MHAVWWNLKAIYMQQIFVACWRNGSHLNVLSNSIVLRGCLIKYICIMKIFPFLKGRKITEIKFRVNFISSEMPFPVAVRSSGRTHSRNKNNRFGCDQNRIGNCVSYLSVTLVSKNCWITWWTQIFVTFISNIPIEIPLYSEPPFTFHETRKYCHYDEFTIPLSCHWTLNICGWLQG